MGKVIDNRFDIDLDDTPKSKEDIRKMIEQMFTHDGHGNPVTPPDDIWGDALKELSKEKKSKYK